MTVEYGEKSAIYRIQRLYCRGNVYRPEPGACRLYGRQVLNSGDANDARQNGGQEGCRAAWAGAQQEADTAGDPGQALLSHRRSRATLRGRDLCAAFLGDRISATEAEQERRGAAVVPPPGGGSCAADPSSAVRRGLHDSG